MSKKFPKILRAQKLHIKKLAECDFCTNLQRKLLSRIMQTPRRTLRNLHLENVSLLSTPLQIPASPFMKNLGYGTGVNVYRLERSPKCGQTRSPWAVKRISQRTRSNGQQLFNMRIHEEAEILRKLSHPNIVGFRGVAIAKDGVDSLALECCTTSLGSILEERNEEALGPLPAENGLKMIADISSALDYLHTQAKILHGDLKSFNILIKGEFEVCKLCDFGVSLPLNDNGVVNFSETPNLRYVGTNLWSAPEVMDEENIIDAKADIFSFGLIIYETIALVPPHTLDIGDTNDTKLTIDSSESKENSSIMSEDSVFEQMEGAYGTRPPLPQAFELSEEYNRIVELFYCSTNELPEDRPTAKSIFESLQKDNVNQTKE